MSTNSRIGYKDNLGNFHSIYCHWDGHLDSVGAILLNHYKDENKVRNLISLGSISSLGKEISPKGNHSYDKPENDVTVAYHRDQNEPEKDTQPITFSNINDLLSYAYEPFVYLFIDNNWFFTANGYGRHNTSELKKLTDKAISKCNSKYN